MSEHLEGMSPAEQAKVRFGVDLSNPGEVLKKMREMIKTTGAQVNPDVNDLSVLYEEYQAGLDQAEAA